MWVVLFVACGVRNFEVLNCQSGHIIHWNLKIHGHRTDLLPAFLGGSLTKSNFGYHRVFHSSLELFNCPLSHLLLSLVFEALSLHSFR